MIRRFVLSALPLVIGAGMPARAQIPPSPADFHGYELGSRYTITAALYDYYRALGASSPRVEYVEYGRSIQGRPLPMLHISSERNLARRDEIQRRVRELTYRTEPLPEAELAAAVRDLPAIVWLFIVDTDEEAGVEVLQEVAYELAMQDGELVRRIRDNALVIVTPLTNPDSHARYVTWHGLYNIDGAATDPNAVENRAHWGMNTDGNALGIDVNRDFGWFVTPEMQALAREVVTWRPQVMLDIHSGPTVIFIPPFPPPYHPLWPDDAPKWWEALSQRASDHFGARGWSFNTREGYEGVTSPGFGLSWGMLSGSVSTFLFETFGGRPGRTTAFRRSDGTIATMRMAMDRHAMGTWSLLEVVASRREELLRDAHETVVQGVADARGGSVRGVIVPSAGEGIDGGKVARMIDRLVLQGIEVHRLTTSTTAAAQDYYGASSERRFDAGSYYIDLAQPQARLARTLLDPTVQENPEVLVPYTRRMPYYDTTWELLPLMFGVDAFTVGVPLRGEMNRVAGPVRPDIDSSMPGTDVEPYAYVMRMETEANYRVLVAMLREGYRFRVFRSGFRLGDDTYPKGTVAALRLRNPEDLGARLSTLAVEHGGIVHTIPGPYTDDGVAFGDDGRLAPIASPLVAVVADQPVMQDHTFGGIRTVLEADFGVAFTPVMLETINRADLSKYSVVVLPHAGMDIRGGPGFSRGYQGLLNLENLRRYVTGGGTLIAVQGAGAVIADDDVLGRDVEFAGWAEYTNGAILRAEWDERLPEDLVRTTWRPGLGEVGRSLIGTGYAGGPVAVPGAYPVLYEMAPAGGARAILSLANDPTRVVLDGFVLDEDRDRLAARPYVIVQPAGRGRVIYFAGDVTFRAHWYGLNTLFLNALLFGPVL